MKFCHNKGGWHRGTRTVSLLAFSNTSECDIAAAVYAKVEDKGGEVSINLVMAKTRINKMTTIPFAKLKGAVLAAAGCCAKQCFGGEAACQH